MRWRAGIDARAFATQLKAGGYTEVETKIYQPKPVNGEHGHHFPDQGLVLEGAFMVIQNDQPVTYGPGEIFTVPASDLHARQSARTARRCWPGGSIEKY